MNAFDALPDFDHPRKDRHTMTSTLPAYLRDSPHFAPTPTRFRIVQRIGNAVYMTPCPDYPDATPSLAVAQTQLATLKAWHIAQEHGISEADEHGFVAKFEGRKIAEYQVKAQP